MLWDTAGQGRARHWKEKTILLKDPKLLVALEGPRSVAVLISSTNAMERVGRNVFALDDVLFKTNLAEA